MDRLKQRELAALRWLLGQLMFMVSLSGGFALDLGADGLILASLALTALTCVLPSLFERVPAAFWKYAPILLLLVIGADFLGSGSDFLPPLFRMVILLALFRALQIRTPREDLQQLLLTMFLLVITGVLSLEITFGIQLLLYAPLAMSQLFLVNLSIREDGSPRASPDGPVFAKANWGIVFRHASARLDRRTLSAGLVLFVITTGMALGLFILMPRFDIGAALPFPRLSTDQSLSGFSDNVQYGDVVSILNDDSIAMRVDVTGQDPPSHPYWRMVVLDAYYDGGFRVSPAVVRNQRYLQNYAFSGYDLNGRGQPDDSEWTIYLEGGISAYLPSADTFKTLRFNNRTGLIAQDLTRVFLTREINANTLSIRYEGARFGGILPFGPMDFQLTRLKPVEVESADPGYLDEVTYPETLLAYPSGAANREILDRALRRSGFSPRQSAVEYAERLVDYLRRDRGYSLEGRIPEGEADTVLRWIQSGQPGHCELYAGAFVLVARYAGFPSRLVTGFAGGDWNGFENYFMVRNRNAHAWCEIYDQDKGWIRVDPTPGSPGGTVESALATGGLIPDRTWKAYLDSLRVLWFRRVIQFDSQDQALMAESLKEAGRGGLGWLRERWKSLREKLDADLREFHIPARWAGVMVDYLLPLTTVLLLVLLILLLRRWARQKGFEAIIRDKAGRLLAFRALRRFPEARHHHQLLLLRYGPVQSWPENPHQLLRQARKQAPSTSSGQARNQ